MAGSRHALAVAAAALVLAGACNEPHLPEGDPAAVIAAAPDRTIAESPVQIEISRPSGRTATTLDLRRGSGEAAAVLDLVRGADDIDVFGGQRVRGVGALRYDVDFDVSVAAAKTPPARRDAVAALAPRSGTDVVRGAVWVDRQGRLVRVLLPSPMFARTRATFRSGAEQVVTYDYFGW